MASPTVFISSTFYDLRHVRESLKRFVENLGYVAVLSEEGAVFYDPSKSAAESCLTEIPNTHLFVLIVGGRYGHVVAEWGKSVTNAEYEQATKSGVPTFALVEQGTYNDYQLYKANLSRTDVLESIKFPNADSVRIFEFIEHIQERPLNNAIVPFSDYRDIELYLRSQWAGMMHNYLTKAVEERKLIDSLAMMNQVNSRIELLAKQILRTVGTETDRLVVRFLERMLLSVAVNDLRYIYLHPTPADILRSASLESCAKALGKPFQVIGRDIPRSDLLATTAISSSGEIAPHRLESSSADYKELRKYMKESLEAADISLTDFSSYPFNSDA